MSKGNNWGGTGHVTIDWFYILFWTCYMLRTMYCGFLQQNWRSDSSLFSFHSSKSLGGNVLLIKNGNSVSPAGNTCPTKQDNAHS